MSLIENKFSYGIHNPYREFSSAQKTKSPYAEKSPHSSSDRLVKIVEKIVNWGVQNLFTSLEKQLDYLSLGARVLDWSFWGVQVSMQGIVFVDSYFRSPIHREILDKLPSILKIIALPMAIFFFILGIIQGITEFLYLKRSLKFLEKMDRQGSKLLNKMQWLRSKYFTLAPKEEIKIVHFIENSLSFLTQDQKALKFEMIAEKALQLRYEAFARRVTPGLAQQVRNELPGILKGLSDPTKEDYKIAMERGQLLITSLTEQSQVKVLVHVVALAAIAILLVSMIGVFAGLTIPALFITLGVLSSCFSLTSFLLDKQVVNKEAKILYKKLFSIPQIKGA